MNFIQVPNHKLQGQRQASCENFVESFFKDNGIVTEKPLKCNRSCSHSKMVYQSHSVICNILSIVPFLKLSLNPAYRRGFMALFENARTWAM